MTMKKDIPFRCHNVENISPHCQSQGTPHLSYCIHKIRFKTCQVCKSLHHLPPSNRVPELVNLPQTRGRLTLHVRVLHVSESCVLSFLSTGLRKHSPLALKQQKSTNIRKSPWLGQNGGSFRVQFSQNFFICDWSRLSIQQGWPEFYRVSIYNPTTIGNKIQLVTTLKAQFKVPGHLKSSAILI